MMTDSASAAILAYMGASAAHAVIKQPQTSAADARSFAVAVLAFAAALAARTGKRLSVAVRGALSACGKLV